MGFTVKKGVVYSKKGIAEAPRWFADSRMSFEMDENYITRVQFMNPLTREGNHTVFLQRLWDGFRYYVEKYNLNYKPEYKNCIIWPFGLQAEWEFEGFTLKHNVYAIDECIVIQLTVPDKIPQDIKFKLEFYENFALIPCDPNDWRFCDMGAQREWRKWEFNNKKDMLCGGFIDTPKQMTAESRQSHLDICVAADFEAEHIKRGNNVKHILKSPSLEAGSTYSFIVSFTHEGDAVERTTQKLKVLNESIKNQFARYEAAAAKSPVLISRNRRLNDFVSLAPMYHEVAKVTYIPGALRASNVHYWVWGWDSMTSNYGTFYWGDSELIKNMLDMYKKYSDPQKGIVHCYRYDMTINEFSPYPAQSMYICLLQQYYAATKDIEVIKKHYSFAKQIFRWNIDAEVRATGFSRGTSLFPDDRDVMLETGNDISTFNNTILYCAARSMEYLGIMMEDSETALEAARVFKSIEENFSQLFFDKEAGFIVTSLDAETLQQRKSYSIASVKWENGYLYELMEPLTQKCMGFIDKNLISKAGLREVPVWSVAFDGDANQHHSWFMINSEYFIRTANGNNRSDLITKFTGFIERWTDKLTCPEGIPYYAETEDIEFDRWNTLKGTWQVFGLKGWYQAVIHGIVGVDVDAGGITFYPYSGEEMKLKGLQAAGKILDIEMKGSGEFIEEINVNGMLVKGTNKLPQDVINKTKGSKVKISVKRTNKNPYQVFVKTAYGLELSSYIYENNTIKTLVSGYGTCRLKVYSEKYPSLFIDGVESDIKYDSSSQTASIELMLDGKTKNLLEILILN